MARTGTDSLAFRYRSALKLMTMANYKTHKGEKAGYLSAVLYLMPHTSGGGVTLCPHSTPACREMCLSGAGLSGLPKQLRAKQNRTSFYLSDPDGFFEVLARDIERLRSIAKTEGMKPVVRLNGTSDIRWEVEAPGLMRFHDDIHWMDYTKIPLEHRRPPANYHLTYSVEGPDSMVNAARYLLTGRSVAIVVPKDVKARWLQPDELARSLSAGGIRSLGDPMIVDGDLNDLRFLDPPGSIVLLSPKGHVRTSLIRPDFLREIAAAARAVA